MGDIPESDDFDYGGVELVTDWNTFDVEAFQRAFNRPDELT